MYQVQSNHHVVYIRSMKGNYIPVIHISLQMISGQDLSLTYKGMYGCYTIPFIL